MYIEFQTREYERTYGHGPKGYGMWVFFFEGHEFWARGTYTEAKKACRAEIKRLAPKGYSDPIFVKVGT